jgi:hypothetical protein
LLRYYPDQERLNDVKARHPGLSVRRTGREDFVEVFLVDTDSGEELVIGEFRASDARPLDEETRRALYEERNEVTEWLEEIARLDEPDFPEATSYRFDELADRVIHYFERVNEARTGIAAVSIADLLELERSFRVDGLEACEEGVRRIRERIMWNFGQDANSN